MREWKCDECGGEVPWPFGTDGMLSFSPAFGPIKIVCKKCEEDFWACSDCGDSGYGFHACQINLDFGDDE